MFTLKPRKFFSESFHRNPIVPSSVPAQCGLCDLQSQPLIAMINAENRARRCSSTTQVAVPAGLSHVTLHSRATLSPYRNQPAKTEHMAYFPSAGHNSWDISFDALACFETFMRFYCDKEAWEINKCPLDNKCYINKRALGSNGILKNVGELTYINSVFKKTLALTLWKTWKSTSLSLTLCTSGVSMQNFQDILNLAEFCRTFQNHMSVFLFIFFHCLTALDWLWRYKHVIWLFHFMLWNLKPTD